MSSGQFDYTPITRYLGLPASETVDKTPIEFLIQHLQLLPPHLASTFAQITTPKERTVIPTIRNRRLTWTKGNPSELSFASARNAWPTLWQGRERRGKEEGQDEKAWAERGFLDGSGRQHVGNLGSLLGEYEEEREAERVRNLRRREAEEAPFVPEEDSDSDEEEEEEPVGQEEEESAEESKAAFERLIKERFIYGLLDSIDYNFVDWNDELDGDDSREVEERWFDEEEEG